MKRDAALKEAAGVLPAGLLRELEGLGDAQREQAEELRLRRGFPMTVVQAGEEIQAGDASVTADDLQTVLENASQASAHTVLDQVKHGFVTLRGGHRIGLCGTVVRKGNEITTMRYLTSMAIRIACPVEGQAGELLPALLENGVFQSTLILAPPGAGKTTLLRDLIRGLSDGECGQAFRVGVADERGEIAALWQGEPQFYIGRHTDVLDGCRKGEGMSVLLRGMNPQILAADEITDPSDVRAVEEAAGCGVALLATAHGARMADLRQRPVYRALLETGVFRRIILLERCGRERRARVEVLT